MQRAREQYATSGGRGGEKRWGLSRRFAHRPRPALSRELWFLLSLSPGPTNQRRESHLTENTRGRDKDGEREPEESEPYLHPICILVDPYCFHLQPSEPPDPPGLSSLRFRTLNHPRLSPQSIFPRSVVRRFVTRVFVKIFIYSFLRNKISSFYSIHSFNTATVVHIVYSPGAR